MAELRRGQWTPNGIINTVNPTGDRTSPRPAPDRLPGETYPQYIARIKGEQVQAEQDREDQYAEDRAKEISQFLAELAEMFPWTQELGLTPEWFQTTAAEASGPAEIVAKIRATDQYKLRLPGIRRTDGSLRMNEAEYFRTEQAYRTLLNQYGFDTKLYANPQSFIGFFEGEVDPNELADRLEVYRGLETGSQNQRDAFYVYAGMNVTTDDLFEAIVDPAAAQRLTDEYNQNVASQKFDYATFITRATEVGQRRVAETLTDLQRRGAVTGQAVQAVININPEFARQIMDSLYTGGGSNLNSTGFLSLVELEEAYVEAALGAAARNAGLALPDKERIQQIRQAGVERARAAEQYQTFGASKDRFTAAVQRLRGGGFTQSNFEEAAFLGNADQASRLSNALANEEAAGRAGGGFRFDQNRAGGLYQRGLRPL